MSDFISSIPKRCRGKQGKNKMSVSLIVGFLCSDCSCSPLWKPELFVKHTHLTIEAVHPTISRSKLLTPVVTPSDPALLLWASAKAAVFPLKGCFPSPLPIAFPTETHGELKRLESSCCPDFLFLCDSAYESTTDSLKLWWVIHC